MQPSTSASSFLPQERQATFSLATLYALRMLGLFMIVPIFSLYATHLRGATPTLIGIALGCYGLTQALFQIPFGRWSDRIGRKPIIALGFIIFGIGSTIAALAPNIEVIILGRCLQGAGAVGSAMSALLVDLTRAEQRTKALAIIGITIGGSFSLAMVLGPVLNSHFNVPTIFWLSTLLAIVALILLKIWVPTPIRTATPNEAASTALTAGAIKPLLHNKTLLRLNWGIFSLHGILTASFVVLPISLQNETGLLEKQQWLLYLPTLLLAFMVIAPLLRMAERKMTYKAALFKLSIGLLAASELLLVLWQHSVLGTAFALWIFFTVFTLLEALLPAAIAQAAPTESKGSAMGLYSSAQFLGIFVGGSLGGMIYNHLGLAAVWWMVALWAVIWLVIAVKKAE